MVNEQSPMELTTPPDMVEEDNTEAEIAALAADESVEVEVLSEPDTSGPISLVIDPEDISGSINRAMQSDPKVLNVINAMVGQKAKTKYEPQVNKLELELETLRSRDVRQEIANMPEETRNQRLATDDNFRKTYSDAQQSDQVLANKRQAQQVTGRINQLVELATERGLSYEKANELMEKVANGAYDVDASGNNVSLDQALNNFQGALFDEISNVARPAGTPQNNAVTTDLEDALDTASPDVGSSGGTATGGVMYTMEQITNMDPLEMLENFPDDDDFNKAVAEGRITGISKESRSVFER